MKEARIGTKPEWAMNTREKAAAERAARGLPAPKSLRWIGWVVALLAVAALAGWFVQSGRLADLRAERVAAEAAALAEAEARAARAAVVQLAPYEVQEMAPTRLTETLKITGSLAPARQLLLTSEISAKVTEVAGRPGEAVTQGQALVTFDSDTLQDQLYQAIATSQATRVQLDQAQTDLARTESLIDRGLQAANTLDRARSTLDQLVASLAAQETLVATARRALTRATVVAPFDGVISARNVEPGEVAAPGAPLMTLVDMTSLEVEATAPVSYAPRLMPGLAVDVTVEGFGGRAFRGRLERLSPIAIEGSRMLPLFVSLENETGELRGGMFATGRIVLEAREAGLAVPVAALRRDADGTFVVTIENGHATRRAVTVGRDWDGGSLVEIDAGLAPGDLVAIAPLPELSPGDRVELLAE